MAVVEVSSAFELAVVGPGIETTYALTRQATTIGRSRAAMPDIEIADTEAAPRHCIVQWNAVAQCHALRVFGVAGAWLNGTLQPGDGAVHPLSSGDEFRIGATRFIYRSTPVAVDGDDEAETDVDVPTVHAAPTAREVYEFEVIPKLGAGIFDWKHPLMSYGPRRRVEAPMQAVRVVITKGTPRPAILAALKSISELVEQSGTATERSAAPLVTLSRWFDSQP
jgi:predicted component of type VI protein secretion system